MNIAKAILGKTLVASPERQHEADSDWVVVQRVQSGVVAAFDLATGGQRWRADLGDPVVGLFRGEGQLVAMQYGWKGGGPEPEITHSRELEDGISVITTVLFSSNGLAGIDPGTGAVRWREDLGEGWMTRYGTRIVHAGSPDHEFLR